MKRFVFDDARIKCIEKGITTVNSTHKLWPPVVNKQQILALKSKEAISLPMILPIFSSRQRDFSIFWGCCKTKTPSRNSLFICIRKREQFGKQDYEFVTYQFNLSKLKLKFTRSDVKEVAPEYFISRTRRSAELK